MKALITVLIGFIACSCIDHNEENRGIVYFVRNETGVELTYRDYYRGDLIRDLLLPVNTNVHVGSEGQLEFDSVEFIMDGKVLHLKNPRYDSNTYEATKDWSYFNRANWIQSPKNRYVFIYTVRSDFF